MGSTPNQLTVLKILIDRGWISLRQLAVLLGLTSIYQRQNGPNRIEVIRIGGMNRVYTDVALQALKDTKDPDKQIEAQTLLNMYDVGLRDKKRRERHTVGDTHA